MTSYKNLNIKKIESFLEGRIIDLQTIVLLSPQLKWKNSTYKLNQI